MDLIGQNLGQYRIVEAIGAGGMASVYKAYQAGLDRYVAIKVLPAQHALTPGFKERFSREARAVAQLSHPNILPIHDVGIENDISYFVMKYVPGQTLRDVMSRSIPLAKICDYIDQIAGALDHAHGSGILHRDIKPVNILMEDEWLLLADFGLAKIVEGTQALTATGSSMGTPAYVSPEQAVGKPVDHRTDIYSLGIILYEMATGQVPYSGETPMGVMFKHVYEALPIPRQLKADLPEAVERVILKALAKDPKDRFNSAGEMAKALRQAVEAGIAEPAAVPIPVAPPPTGTSVPGLEQTVLHQPDVTKPATPAVAKTVVTPDPAAGDRPPIWLWIGAGLLALLILSGVIFAFSGGSDDPISKENGGQQIALVQASASPALDIEQSETPDQALQAKATARATATVQAQTASDSPVTETPIPEPTSTRPPPPPTPTPTISNIPQLSESTLLGRGPINEIAISPNGETMAVASSLGVWLYTVETLTPDQLLPNPGSPVWSSAWSPDGLQLATASEDGLVHIWDVASRTERHTLAGHTGPALNVAWSADGQQLASGSEDASVRIWDVNSGQEVAVLTGHLYETYSIAWAPTANQLVSASRDGTIRVWDVNSGGELRRLESHLDEVYSIDWSPDGTQLVSGSSDLTLRLWDTEQWQEENTLTGHTGPVISVAWSPDGAQVASAGFDGTVRLWDVATGIEAQILEGHTQAVSSMAWTAAGERVISGGLDGVLRVWETKSGQEVAQAAIHTSLLRDVAWSPSGQQLASVGFDGVVRLWDVAGQTLAQTLVGDDTFLLGLSWSPDGQQIAAGTDQGSVQIWEISSGDVTQTLVGHSGQVNAVAWSPDGRQVASASADQTIRIWDSISGAAVREISGHAGDVKSIAWSPDGMQLVSGSYDRTVSVWDALSGEELRTLEGRTGSDAYQLYFSLRGSNDIDGVAWSPDGRRLAAASRDFVIRLWDAASGAELRMLEGHESPVLNVAWSPDSTRFASAGGRDRTVRIWNAANGQAQYILRGHVDTIYSVDWSPDGKQVASTGNDGIIHVWDVPAE